MSRQFNVRSENAPPRRNESASIRLAVLSVCFLLSGSTGLIYQVLWGRILSLTFGSTTAATGTVLAIFMGGLALGGWWAGERADRLRRPLRTYALLECGVGLSALLASIEFAAAPPLVHLIWPAFGYNGPAVFALRLTVTCAALLPPTIMMGATLPVLGRYCAIGASDMSARIGLLYGMNTIGAAVGAFLAGFVLIPRIGVSATTAAAAFVNILLFAVTFWFDRKFSLSETAPPERSESKAGKPRQSKKLQQTPTPVNSITDPRLLTTTLLAFSVSGAVALVYEVAWTRALLLIIGSNIHAFAAMLTTFLLGLFLGALLAARFAHRLRRPLAALAWAELAVGVTAWAGFANFDSLPWMSLSALDPRSGSANAALVTRFGLPALVMLPSAVCLGALFPLAVQACETGLATIGRKVGCLYACNTFGAIVGALAASFYLIPHFGTQITLHVAMATNAALAILFWSASAPVKRRPGDQVLNRWPALLFAVVMIWVGWPTRWDDLAIIMAQPTRHVLAQYVSRTHEMPYPTQAVFLQETQQQQNLLFEADGTSSHVAVVQFLNGRGLLTNGHQDASDTTDMPTQVLLAGLPLLLHADQGAPLDTAVVGWGSSVTAGVAEHFPIRKITALELEPEVFRASNFFETANHHARSDRRLQAIVEDARSYFLFDRSTYDVIISEPSNVWQAGVCNLFTRDYFQICKARLRPNGLFAQWLSMGNVPTNEIRGTLAALRQVFPNILLFRISDIDAIVVASVEPLKLNAARVQSRYLAADATLKNDLNLAGVPDAAHLAVRIAMNTDEIAAFCAGERPNTDDNARMEFAVASAYELQNYSDDMKKAILAVRRQDPLSSVDMTGLSREQSDAFRAQWVLAAQEREHQ